MNKQSNTNRKFCSDEQIQHQTKDIHERLQQAMDTFFSEKLKVSNATSLLSLKKTLKQVTQHSTQYHIKHE